MSNRPVPASTKVGAAARTAPRRARRNLVAAPNRASLAPPSSSSDRKPSAPPPSPPPPPPLTVPGVVPPRGPKTRVLFSGTMIGVICDGGGGGCAPVVELLVEETLPRLFLSTPCRFECFFPLEPAASTTRPELDDCASRVMMSTPAAVTRATMASTLASSATNRSFPRAINDSAETPASPPPPPLPPPPPEMLCASEYSPPMLTLLPFPAPLAPRS